MSNEKDMIEINLSSSMAPAAQGKGFNYFDNIRFAKSHGGGYPYGQYQNESVERQMGKKANSTFCGMKINEERSEKISCLRQMYCPDCQQRLDDESIFLEKQGLCCVPLFSINRFYQCYLRRQHGRGRKVYCKNCGGNMGYWKDV